MATATRKVRGAAPRARPTPADSGPASLAFVISQDNRGEYLWEIVDSDGRDLVHSGGFGSRDEAERAAHYVHDSARLAHFAAREPGASKIGDV